MEKSLPVERTKVYHARMMRRLALCFALLLPLFLVSCAGCGGNQRSLPYFEANWQKVYGEKARAGVPKSTAFKGLAHPRKDPFLYRKQLKTVPHVAFGGFMFHRQPIPVSADALSQVAALYADPASHRARREIKPCPGFHPDWVLVWRDTKGEWLLQICYGCHEWKLIGPDGALYTDIADGAFWQLRALLPK